MNPNGQGQAIPTVPIGQVPSLFAVGQAPGPDGRPLVMLAISTPVGQFVYLLDGDCAITTGQNLRQAGKATKAGFVLPGDIERADFAGGATA